MTEPLEREYNVIVTQPDGTVENVVLMASDFNHAVSEALAEFEGATINGICLSSKVIGRWVVERRVPATAAHKRNHDHIEHGLATVLYGPFADREAAVTWAVGNTCGSDLPFKIGFVREVQSQ